MRKQGALSLPMGVRASTRGTLEPDIWCKRLLCGGKGAKPSSDGLRLEASKVRNRAKSAANLGQLKDTAVGPSRSRHGDGGEPTWPANSSLSGEGRAGQTNPSTCTVNPKDCPTQGTCRFWRHQVSSIREQRGGGPSRVLLVPTLAAGSRAQGAKGEGASALLLVIRNHRTASSVLGGLSPHGGYPLDASVARPAGLRR